MTSAPVVFWYAVYHRQTVSRGDAQGNFAV